MAEIMLVLGKVQAIFRAKLVLAQNNKVYVKL
jgi:hypothetical protein